jgi:hypothetical protein
MCNVPNPFAAAGKILGKGVKAGENIINSAVAAPGDIADSLESTVKSLKPKPPQQPDQVAPTPVFFADPTQSAMAAAAVQRRKPRSLLSAAGGGDTSTAATSAATTMAKATLGA